MAVKVACPYCRHTLITTGLCGSGHTLYHCAACDRNWSIKEDKDET